MHNISACKTLVVFLYSASIAASANPPSPSVCRLAGGAMADEDDPFGDDFEKRIAFDNDAYINTHAETALAIALELENKEANANDIRIVTRHHCLFCMFRLSPKNHFVQYIEL